MKFKKAIATILLSTMLASAGAQAAFAQEALAPEITQVTGGQIMGYNDNGVYAFKGIPYGTAQRFEEAVPSAWEGMANCLTLGEVCPQDRTLAATYHTNDAEFITPAANDMCGSEETCLNLNVWTNSMDETAKKPVVVFMHGGGLSNGSSGELAVYDGANFAATTDAVFVSVNMRLNYLGFLDVSAYGDETYKNSGNLGLTDMVLALQWVQDNIATFGGDPANVAIYGQSGGGTKVTSLASLPATEGLFDRVAVISGGYTTTTQEQQQAETAKLVEYLGLTEADDVIGTLKAMSYEELYNACNAAEVRVSAQVDGDYFPTPWYNPETGEMNEYAKERTYLVSSAFSEFMTSGEHLLLDERFHGEIDMNYYRPDMTDEWKETQLTERFGDKKDAVLEAFAEAYPNHDTIDALWYTNRAGALGQVAACVSNDVPVYNCVMAYNVPFMGGVTMWHSGDIGYWFNSLDRLEYQIKGDEENAYAVAAAASSALASFASDGNPSTDSLVWNAYTEENPVTMVFDSACYEKADLDTELLNLAYSE